MRLIGRMSEFLSAPDRIRSAYDSTVMFMHLNFFLPIEISS